MEMDRRILFYWITKKGPYISFCCILLGLLLHIIGVSTTYWLEGSKLDGPDNTTDVMRVNVGLLTQRLEFKNWTVLETDSSLTNQAPQVIVLIVACISTVLCSITIVKAVHIVVGTSGFIVMPLLVVALVLIQSDMEINRDKVQTGRTSWPPLSISWSFHLVFAGLFINTVSTGLFLTLQLESKPDYNISKVRLSTMGV